MIKERKNWIGIIIAIITALIICMCGTKIVWADNASISSSEKIHFIKLGNADSFLIESNGHYGLIDSGYPSPSASLANLDSNSTYNAKTIIAYMQKLGVKSLDFVIATHSHSDHIGGIEELCNANYINSNTVYIYKEYQKVDREEGGEVNWYNSNFYNLAIQSASSKGATLFNVKQHDVTKLAKIDPSAKYYSNSSDICASIEFNFQSYNIKLYNIFTYTANGTAENPNSIITLITKGTNKMLFMGDMDTNDYREQAITKHIGNVKLYKVGHHGSGGSNAYESLQNARPQIAVLSTGLDDATLQDQSSVMLGYFKNNGVSSYRTAEANLAVVACVSSNDIKMYTYNNSGILGETPTMFTASPKTGLVIQKNNTTKVGTTYSWIEEKAYINENGTFFTGWKLINDKWYYFDKENIIARTGWFYEGEQWYYLYKSTMAYHEIGEMARGLIDIYEDGKTNYFYFCQAANEVPNHKEGSMITGWHTVNGNRYYFIEDEKTQGMKLGARAEGWIPINGKAYYFNSNGINTAVDDKSPTIQSITGNPENWEKNATLQINASDGDGIGLHETPYSFDGGNTWQASNKKTVTSNGTITIKVRDKAGNTSNATEVKITKVDSEPPTNSAPSIMNKSKNSITVKSNQQDTISGIDASTRQYSIKKASASSWTTVSDTSETHTFNGLTANTSYQIKTFVKDNAGNEKESSVLTVTTSKEETPQEPKTITEKATLTPNTKSWTNQNITVTASTNTSYTIQTKQGNGGWTNTNVQTVTKNGTTVYARLTDGTNYGPETSVTINNIEKSDPTIKSVTPSRMTISAEPVTLTVVATADSGIKEYSFDNGTTWQTTNTKVYNENTSEIRIKVRSNAGNETTYSEIININIISSANDVERIRMVSQPTKKDYVYKTEKLDLTGAKIEIIYGNGTTKTVDITPDMVSGFNNEIVGNNTVTVTYKENNKSYDTSFVVRIVGPEVQGIQVTTSPTKIVYKDEGVLEVVGGIIRETYTDGTTTEIPMNNENVEISGYDLNKPGKQELTVSYNGKRATFNTTFEIENNSNPGGNNSGDNGNNNGNNGNNNGNNNSNNGGNNGNNSSNNGGNNGNNNSNNGGNNGNNYSENDNNNGNPKNSGSVTSSNSDNSASKTSTTTSGIGVKDTTTASGKLPQTGTTPIIIVIVVAISIGGITFILYKKNDRKIKGK